MKKSSQLTERLAKMVQARNRELVGDALLKAGLGIVFSLLTFGFVFWTAWIVSFCYVSWLGMSAWQLAAIVTGVFFIVACWSAWRRVNPLAGLAPLTDSQRFLTELSHLSGGEFVYFSPRHASAGFALILIGGPANLVEAFGIWMHRLRADAEALDQAARLLPECRDGCSSHLALRFGAGAILLHRLALIKMVPRDESAMFTLTDKGHSILGKART
jgi:hypothetical protein